MEKAISIMLALAAICMLWGCSDKEKPGRESTDNCSKGVYSIESAHPPTYLVEIPDE